QARNAPITISAPPPAASSPAGSPVRGGEVVIVARVPIGAGSAGTGGQLPAATCSRQASQAPATRNGPNAIDDLTVHLRSTIPISATTAASTKPRQTPSSRLCQ